MSELNTDENQLALWGKDDTPPDQLDVQTIENMHPDLDGYLPILRKDPTQPGRLKNVYSGKVRDLATWLPPLVDQLLEDSYGAVNTMTEPWKDKYGTWHYRNKRMVNRLCACYVDLDHDELNLTFEQAFGELGRLIAAESLPWPSLLARSGNGMYVIWQLELTKPTNDNHWLYYHTNDRLGKMLKHLGADPRAKDAARILRLPGSYHTRTGLDKNEPARVRYIPFLTANGEMVQYKLDKLYELVSYPLPQETHLAEKPRKRIEAKVSAADKTRSLPVSEPLASGSLAPQNLPKFEDAPQKRTARVRMNDLVVIAEQRGGILEGYRTHFLRAFATSLTTAYGHYGQDLWRQVMKTNERACKPPKTKREVYDICSSVYRYYMTDKKRPRQVRSDTIAGWLRVTSTEVRNWGLESIMPGEERQRKNKAQKRHCKARRLATADRRNGLADMLKRRGRKPSLRMLAGEFDVSYETIRKDLGLLGVQLYRSGFVRKRQKKQT